MFERILAPLDGSRLSNNALPYAIKLAKQFKAELTLVRVVPPSHVTFTKETMDILPKPTMEIAFVQDKREMEMAKRYLNKKAEELAAVGMERVHCLDCFRLNRLRWSHCVMLTVRCWPRPPR